MVKRALLLMQQRIDAPLSVTEIARQMGNSKRQLERHFRAALDTSPQAAFLGIRLSFARHLLEATDKSISAIAVECGFCDSSHLSRMFRSTATSAGPLKSVAPRRRRRGRWKTTSDRLTRRALVGAARPEVQATFLSGFSPVSSRRGSIVAMYQSTNWMTPSSWIVRIWPRHEGRPAS